MKKIFLHHAMQRHVDLVMHAVQVRGRKARRRCTELLDRAATHNIGKLQRITRRIFQEQAGGLWSNHGGLVLCAAVGQSVASIVREPRSMGGLELLPMAKSGPRSRWIMTTA
jgi:hypothetical protein